MTKLMVADDSKFMREHLKGILKQHGYNRIFEASNGEEAIDIYMYINPDLVILDITLPDISGLMVLKKILEYDPNAIVIMCSALATKSNLLDAKKIGAKGFVIKPYFDELID